MNLRNRTILTLGLIFFVFFILIAAVSLSVTLSGLDRIEYQDMHEAVVQTQSALNAEAQSLLSTTQDWAWWDDMASYAVRNNTGFIERNANPENLATVRLHLFIVLDAGGNVLHSTLQSPDFKTNGSAPADILRNIRAQPRLTSLSSSDPGSSGLLQFPEGSMIVASAPILLSDKSGPSRGTVVMGRYLDSGPLNRISSVTRYDVALHWQDPAGNGIPVPDNILRQLEQQPLVLAADNESRITGYRLMDDLSGSHPVLSVTISRNLYKTGFSSIMAYLALLALWAVITGVIVVIVLDRTVLVRMDLLATRVSTLTADHSDNPALVLSGNDELAALEQMILLSRADLSTRERQIRAFMNAMPDPAALCSREGTILFANTALATYFSKQPAGLIGTPVYRHLPQEEVEKYRQQALEAIRKKAMVQFETEIQGKTLIVSHYPVLDEKGTVIQIGLMSFDISERKRFENALQKVTKKISLLNTVIFTDIQNKVFVQLGYLANLKRSPTDPRLMEYLDKEESAVKDIVTSLQFARQYHDMGANPPRWQNVQEVLLFALSHLDIGGLSWDFRLDGTSIYADPLLERVFFNLIQNSVQHAKGATVIRARYEVTGDTLRIILEDDGPGVPDPDKEKIFSKGAGTRGSVGLFLSREILSITGITISETGAPGKRARFEILVPKGSYRVPGK